MTRRRKEESISRHRREATLAKKVRRGDLINRTKLWKTRQRDKVYEEG